MDDYQRALRLERMQTLVKWMDMGAALTQRSNAELAAMLTEIASEFPLDSPVNAVLVEAADRLGLPDEDADQEPGNA